MEWEEQGYSNDICLKFLVGIYQQVRVLLFPMIIFYSLIIIIHISTFFWYGDLKSRSWEYQEVEF